MPESGGSQASHLRYPDNDHLTANAEDFSLALEMAMRESLMSLSLLVPQSPVISGNKKARPKSGSFLERVKGIEPS